jgi:uncharacterized repeat protein (TIGR01451 family)
MRYLLLLAAFVINQIDISAQLIPPCVTGNTAPSDICGAACVRCGSTTLTASTAGYLPEAALGFCETIENNVWLGFHANQSTTQVVITPQNCAQGVEAAIYTSCNSLPIACSTGGNTAFQLDFQSVAGAQYLLMVDGKNGDQCTFEVTFPSGGAPTLLPTLPISGPTSICPGASGVFTVPAVSGASHYVWDGPPGSTINGALAPVTLDASIGTTVNIGFPMTPSAGIFQICVLPVNSCNDGTLMCKTINIQSIPPTVFPNITVCPEGLPFITPWGLEVNGTGLYTENLLTPYGCDSTLRMFVFVAPPIITVLPPKFLCLGDSIQVCGQIFKNSGSYSVTCSSFLGCDSTIIFTIVMNQVGSIITHISQSDPDSLFTSCNSIELRASSFFHPTQPPIWYNALGDSIATGSTYQATSSGWYFIEVPSSQFGTAICSPLRDSVYVRLGSVDVPIFTASIDSVDCSSGYSVLSAQSNALNLSYTWSGPNQFLSNQSQISVSTPGQYSVFATDTLSLCASNDTVLIVSYANPVKVNGVVLLDMSQTCDPSLATSVGGPISLVAVNNQPSSPSVTFQTNSNGSYQVTLPSGEYDLDGVYPFDLCTPLHVSVGYCLPSVQIITQDLLINNNISCPNINVSLLPWPLRRCMDSAYKLRVQNFGTVANHAYVEVTLDTFIQFLNSTPPPTSVQGQKLIYQYGSLNNTQLKEVLIDVKVSCSAPAGYVHCTTAHAYPDSVCNAWQGPILTLSGACQGDSVSFTVTNTGIADMNNSEIFHFVTNAINDSIGQVQLQAGESQVFRFRSGGFNQFTVSQVPNYSLNQQLSVRVVGCSTNMPIITTLGNQSQHFEYIACTPNTGSFDPNDKRGFPEGAGPDGNIAQGSNLSYVIRFQNTGTDTAFTVVIKDTLSDLLNPYSIRPGASTHPYTWKIDAGNVLVFRFDQIMLPDSNINERASHGAVEFTIDQYATNSAFAEIYNSAAIYFDFNDPVITNTTKHTNGIPLPIIKTNEPTHLPRLYISPNPASQSVLVQGQNMADGLQVNYQIYNDLGQIVQQGNRLTHPLRLTVDGLPTGRYTLKLQSDDAQAVGVFVKQ